MAGISLHGVLHLGSTTFFGASSDVLGFSNFNEVGFSIRTDISKLKSPFSSLSLGAMVVFGDNISGWGLLAGYSF